MVDVYEKLNELLKNHAMATRPSESFEPVPIPKTTAPAIPKAPSIPKAPKLPRTPQERASEYVERERARTEPKGSLVKPPAKV